MRYNEFKIKTNLSEVKMSPGKFSKFLSGAGKSMTAGFEAELIFPNYSWLKPTKFNGNSLITDNDTFSEFFSTVNPPHVVVMAFDILRTRVIPAMPKTESVIAQRLSNIQNAILSGIHTACAMAGIPETLYKNTTSMSTLIDNIGGVRGLIDVIQTAERQSHDNSVDKATQSTIKETYILIDELYKMVSMQILKSMTLKQAYDAIKAEASSRLKVPFDFKMPTDSSSDAKVKQVTDLLAEFLQETNGFGYGAVVNTRTSQNDYTQWSFEMDGSLRQFDTEESAGVEIVSPVMPLAVAVELMPKFFKWVESKGGHAAKKTGFHMSVSTENFDLAKLDYVKMALFLGDMYVLNEFDRIANEYTVPAIVHIANKIEKTEKGVSEIAQFFSVLRQKNSDFMKNVFAMGDENNQDNDTNIGFGKYVSLNPKNKYIEVRSAGNANYFDDLTKLQNMLLRYAYALFVACDASILREEYAKKLYQIYYQAADVSDKLGNAHDNLINLLDAYSKSAVDSSGSIDQRTLKNVLRADGVSKLIRANVVLSYGDNEVPVSIKTSIPLKHYRLIKRKKTFTHDELRLLPKALKSAIAMELIVASLYSDTSDDLPTNVDDFDTVSFTITGNN